MAEPRPGGTDGPRWLTDEQQQVWRKLVAVLIRLPAALETQLQRDAGLTHMGYFVLVLLADQPDRTLPMSRLAVEANSSLSRLSHVVARLQHHGWVQRRRCPTDGRVQLATLTDAGLAKVVDAAPGHVELVQRLVFDVVAADQLDQVAAVCDALLAALRPEEPAGS